MSSDPPIEPRAIPHAGRPRGAAWRALQAEGVEWEAQVLIGTEERALSARLVVTSERLAFARGGDVVLDIARSWLRQPPFLSGNGAINLRIDTGGGQRDRMQFSARDGRQAATDLVYLLTHGKPPEDEIAYEPEFTRVPPRRRSTLRPDPAFESDTPPATVVEHKYTPEVIDASTLQVLDPTDFPPLTEAATPTTNLKNAPDGGRGSSEPIMISTLANQSHRAGEWSLHPIPNVIPASQKLSRAGWAFRLSGLLLLIALAAAFGTDRLPHASRLPGSDNFIAAPNDESPTSALVAQNVPTATEPVTLPIETSVGDSTAAAAETSIALGVGAETVALTSDAQSATATGTSTPPARATATRSGDIGAAQVETATSPAKPAATATTEIIEQATELPPTATATIAPPTETATAVPPTATETLVPVETATGAPAETATAIPPTATETAVVPTATETSIPPTATLPAFEASTATETPAPTTTNAATATETATAEPTATPTPGFPPQTKTVDETGNPDQVFATGAFRYTIELAERGSTLPTLQLPATDGQDWVVIVLYAQNWSDEPATLNMTDFQLLVSGDFGWQFIGLDASTTQIGQFLGFDPVLEPTDLTSIKDGQGIRMALVFSIPTASDGIEFIDDTSGLNLGDSLAIGGDVTDLGRAPVLPGLISATVMEVIDGRTIVVQDADGYTATIQYLGVNVPTGDICYAPDATQLNSDITLGNTVYLEREYRNRVTTDGDALARDVWIDNQQGGFVLVAAWMASEGAAVASPADQDTRFSGWIEAAAGAAEANGYGFWAKCGEEPVGAETDNSSTDNATAGLPVDPLLDFDN